MRRQAWVEARFDPRRILKVSLIHSGATVQIVEARFDPRRILKGLFWLGLVCWHDR